MQHGAVLWRRVSAPLCVPSFFHFFIFYEKKISHPDPLFNTRVMRYRVLLCTAAFGSLEKCGHRIKRTQRIEAKCLRLFHGTFVYTVHDGGMHMTVYITVHSDLTLKKARVNRIHVPFLHWNPHTIVVEQHD